MIFNDIHKHKNNESLICLCNRCREHLISQLGTTVAEKGKTKGFQVHFRNIVKSWNIKDCGLRIVQSFKGDDIRAVEIYATFPDGSGYEMKNILFHGTNCQVNAFLSDKKLTEEMIETFDHFSESIADRL